MSCIYVDRTNLTSFKKCKYQKKYGNFCKTHRNLYLLKDNIIIQSRYTNNIRDYKRIDYINSILDIHPNSKIKHLSKSKLVDIYLSIVDKDLYYKNHIIDIIKIQSLFRKKKANCDILRGIGYYYKDLCKNNEDFYFMTTIQDTPNIYIFTYRDTSNSVWFFDMRSLDKLLQADSKNPYTRETINNNIINRFNRLKYRLQNQKINIEINQNFSIDKEASIKQKTVDICSTLSQFGYYCDIEWFLSLSLNRLKRLYKKLEDIWNYRTFLSYEMKSSISPPNGIIFDIPIGEIYDKTDILEVQDIILNYIITFNNANTLDNKRLGYMYFLIGLSEVNPFCLECHEWIQFALN